MRLMCAIATAVLWWAAGQGWGLFALGWIALVPLFWALCGCSARARWRLGFLTGACSFALINWWIAPTIAHAGIAIGVPFLPGALLGVFAVALIAVIHGSLVALISWLWNPPSRDQDALDGANARGASRSKTAGRPAALELCWPLAIAGAWALLDAARSETPLAHSWGALAFTQWRDGALWQIASVVGQHGLTFLCVWFAASLALWMRNANPNAWRLPVAVFVACHCWGALRLAQTPFMAQDAVPSTTASALALPHEYSISARNLESAAPSSAPSFTTSSATTSAAEDAAAMATGARGAKGLRVLLVQTDVPSLRKSEADEPFRQAYSLTRDAARRGAFDLIAWPETTATISLPSRSSSERSSSEVRASNTARDEELASAFASTHGGQMRALAALSRDVETPILFGARDVQPDGENFNRAVMLAPDGRFWSSDKERLVPFGERAPFAEYLPFLHRLAPQPEVSANGKARLLPLPRPATSDVGASPPSPRMSTHAPGIDAPNFQKGGANGEVAVGAIVCFESCFRFPARRLKRAGARALFVLTNDEWFGGTDAPWQHSVMAAMRAVENDVPIAQAGNGGFSFAVDRCGRFMVKSSLNQARALPVFLPLDDAG